MNYLKRTEVSEIRPMEVHKRFVELMERRDRADEMLMALLEHPRFRETGDGIFKIKEDMIDLQSGGLCHHLFAAAWD